MMLAHHRRSHALSQTKTRHGSCIDAGLLDLGRSLRGVEIKRGVPVATALGHLLDIERGQLGFRQIVLCLEMQMGVNCQATAMN